MKMRIKISRMQPLRLWGYRSAKEYSTNSGIIQSEGPLDGKCTHATPATLQCMDQRPDEKAVCDVEEGDHIHRAQLEQNTFLEDLLQHCAFCRLVVVVQRA